MYSLFVGNETLPFSVYEPIAIKILLVGTVPNIWERVKLRSRVWYSVKVLCIRYNLFAGTKMLSISVHEPIAIHILLGPSPNLGETGRVRGSSVVPRESPSQWS